MRQEGHHPSLNSPRSIALMPSHIRRLVSLFAVTLATCALSGCGTINEKLANGMGDYMPQWLGGLPADAPPRPGTPKYDEWMKERERQRLQPAPAANTANTNSSTSPASSTAPNPAH
jgi:hypothetical protein